MGLANVVTQKRKQSCRKLLSWQSPFLCWGTFQRSALLSTSRWLCDRVTTVDVDLLPVSHFPAISRRHGGNDCSLTVASNGFQITGCVLWRGGQFCQSRQPRHGSAFYQTRHSELLTDFLKVDGSIIEATEAVMSVIHKAMEQEHLQGKDNKVILSKGPPLWMDCAMSLTREFLCVGVKLMTRIASSDARREELVET